MTKWLLAAIPLLVWVAFWYAGERDVPTTLAAVLLPSFLLELALYLLTASQQFRARLPRARFPVYLSAAALPSYLLYTIPTATFQPMQAAAIFAMAGLASFWYTFAGRRAAADIGFLVIMAAPVLFKVFDNLYPSPASRLPMQTLGVVMWYRTGLLAALVIREFPNIGFGLLPRRIDWSIGVRQFLLFLLPGLALAWALEFIRPEAPEFNSKLVVNAAATFFGTLWFLAVAEEFFFRGLLQQTLARAFRSDLAALLLASVIFGLAHLGFRDFPNWRFAIVAALAGVFYGRAYMQAASIRAAMVTHAFVVTLWRVFLSR